MVWEPVLELALVDQVGLEPQYLFVAVTLGSQAAVAQANLRIQGQPSLQGEFQNR